MGTGSGSGANGEEVGGRGSPLPSGGHECCHPLLSATPGTAQEGSGVSRVPAAPQLPLSAQAEPPLPGWAGSDQQHGAQL